MKQLSYKTVTDNWRLQYQSPQNSFDEDQEIISIPIIKPNLTSHIIKYRLDRDCCSKVLIVDDEYFNIISIQFLLKSFHCKTDYAFNG
jgi:hypothetical protein